ncbi:DUF1997 domain-containing protein [Leptolyngbya sp. PCC 6406]|uniref:DUF1997 domain-containing protein n=1 Tax=Leptolyngbya sp. PCC 6406 TaxID=1173264 RepID=UPI0002AC1D2E|nr:DUF1997 domain-containing protein [Leptolyngbya sp. PCC 6406]
MQTPFTDLSSASLPEQPIHAVSGWGDSTAPREMVGPSLVKPFIFHGAYVGSMEMAADRQTVANYLDIHQDWFRRCAHPMTAEAIGDTGYALTVGHFGAMGYDIEPRIGLNLLPQDHGVYRIETIPVPGYTPQGYDVDFRAALELKEQPAAPGAAVLTTVEWTLDLDVAVQFPRFIRALPPTLLQRTGDHLLSQVVRQVSRCLTHKVQEDFHSTLGLSLPESFQKRHHQFLERFSKGFNRA